jgi:hypothetical protein
VKEVDRHGTTKIPRRGVRGTRWKEWYTDTTYRKEGDRERGQGEGGGV